MNNTINLSKITLCIHILYNVVRQQFYAGNSSYEATTSRCSLKIMMQL